MTQTKMRRGALLTSERGLCPTASSSTLLTCDYIVPGQSFPSVSEPDGPADEITTIGVLRVKEAGLCFRPAAREAGLLCPLCPSAGLIAVKPARVARAPSRQHELWGENGLSKSAQKAFVNVGSCVVNKRGNRSGGLWEEAVERNVRALLKVRCCIICRGKIPNASDGRSRISASGAFSGTETPRNRLVSFLIVGYIL